MTKLNADSVLIKAINTSQIQNIAEEHAVIDKLLRKLSHLSVLKEVYQAITMIR